MRTVLVVLCIALLSPICVAATLFVPDNYPRIQDAISAAVNGDTVVVRPGKYVESIDFLGKEITLRSEKGPLVTTIDGNRIGAILFMNNESRNAVLEGFTCTNGQGIICQYSAPTIRGNVIVGSSRDGIACFSAPTIVLQGNRIESNPGNGIYCTDSDGALIEGNRIASNGDDGIRFTFNRAATISGNEISRNGDKGIWCVFSDGTLLSGNRITSNIADGLFCSNTSVRIVGNVIAGNDGEGINARNADQAWIEHNTILDNGKMGIDCHSAHHVEVTNTIVRGNTSWEISPSGTRPVVTHCNVEGGFPGISSAQGGYPGTGNFDSDPLFADSANGDYHITWNSPCRDAGITLDFADPTDFEGDPRVVGRTPDVGADEFNHHLYTVGTALPGAALTVRIVGAPGQVARLGVDRDALPTPMVTPYGELWLPLPPRALLLLGPVPSTGILTHVVTVPSGWTSGARFPAQALVGSPGGSHTRLTNLLMLEIE